MAEPLITLKWLKEHRACEHLVWLWQDCFDDTATVADTVGWLHKRGIDYWEAWLLAQTPEMTKAMLVAGANVHAADDEALVEATYFGRLEVVKILCAAGVDVNAWEGQALRTAVLCGYLAIIKELRAAGADLSVIGSKLLRTTKKNGYLEVVDYIKSVMGGKDE